MEVWSNQSAYAAYCIETFLHMDMTWFKPSRPKLWNFRHSFSYENISVDFDPYPNSPNSGVVVTMSGGGCDSFEAYSEWDSWEDFLKFCYAGEPRLGFHCSRLDLAIDDIVSREQLEAGQVGLLDPDTVSVYGESRSFRSRSSIFSVIKELTAERVLRGNPGFTLYIGSQKSKQGFSRIYDKAVEQSYDGHWMRVELVCKNDHAMALVDKLCSSIPLGTVVVSMLENRFSFVEDLDHKYFSSGMMNKAPVSSWWTVFLSCVSKEETQLCLTKRIKSTVEKAAAWVNKQVVNSLALLRCAFGFDFFDRFKDVDWQDLPERYQNMLFSWRRCNEKYGELEGQLSWGDFA